MNNLAIYEIARAVPEEAKKPIKGGRLNGMTDISPMWRIKKLTEMFGPCGVGWWYDIVDKHLAADENTKQVAAFVDIKLYYVDPDSGATSHGIYGTGGASFVAQESRGAYMSDECYKMALTDAISVAAKALGVGADVYWDKDSKYSAPPPPAAPAQPTPMFQCECCGQVLKPYNDANGVEVSIRKHAQGSIARFNGHVYCLECIQSGRITERV